jgi:hypothetical protein
MDIRELDRQALHQMFAPPSPEEEAQASNIKDFELTITVPTSCATSC